MVSLGISSKMHFWVLMLQKRAEWVHRREEIGVSHQYKLIPLGIEEESEATADGLLQSWERNLE